MSDKGDNRTAPASPGLLKILKPWAIHTCFEMTLVKFSFLSNLMICKKKSSKICPVLGQVKMEISSSTSFLHNLLTDPV